MRMYKSFVLAVIILASTLLPASAEVIPAEFNLHGAGYGHGVGMSQMGARYMALTGQAPDQILKYFYKDVEISSMDDSKLLRINIGHLLNELKISTGTNAGLVQVYSGDIKNQSDSNPIAEFTNKATLKLSVLGASVLPSVSVGKKTVSYTKSRALTIRWSGTRYLSGVDALISVNHNGSTTKYRYGQLQVRTVKDKALGYRLELTNTVRLADEYLWGVSEMPSYWPTAALQAQAIASRTYALSKAGAFKSSCDCDLYGEISDQMFLGYAKEAEIKYGLMWKNAVTETAGLVLTQAGLPITAYFFSSSGGKTELAVNAWGSEKSFTQIVDDPGSLDTSLNPRFYMWDRSISQAVVAVAFSLPDVVSLEILSRNESGTVGQIRAVSSQGIESTLRGESFRSRAKLPSAYFDLIGMQN